MSTKIQTITIFNTPAHVNDDLTDEQKLAWSTELSKIISREIKGEENQEPLQHFFDGTLTQYDINQIPRQITWRAIPHGIVKPNQRLIWKEADSSREKQDEYLEWSVKKNNKDQIEFVTFTCEMPEYWEHISQVDRSKLVSLYRDLNPEFRDQIQEADLFDASGYIKKNHWNNNTNTGCIAHMIQTDNNITAAIEIAARATIVRHNSEGIVTDMDKLIHCSNYGIPSRESDPQIGSDINTLVRQKNRVSLANPLGVYMYSFDESNFKLDVTGTGRKLERVPDGTFRWLRGDIRKNMGLRLLVKIPDGVVGTGPKNKGRQLNVTDIIDTSNMENIRYGAQFTEHIHMVINAVGTPMPEGEVIRSRPCLKKDQAKL